MDLFPKEGHEDIVVRNDSDNVTLKETSENTDRITEKQKKAESKARKRELKRNRQFEIRQHRHSKLPKMPIAEAGPPLCEFLYDQSVIPANYWAEKFSGESVFLICGGPSMREFDWDRLEQPGVLTASVNNAPLGKAWKTKKASDVFRPHFWFCVDEPKHFHEVIWRDSSVMKFTKDKFRKAHKFRTMDGDDKHWVGTAKLVETRNVWYYYHSKRIPDDDFFVGHPTWGTNPHKSVMFVAIRILYWLGIRRIFLLGADFNQTPKDSYSFDDPMPSGRAQYNTEKFGHLDDFFNKLLPTFNRYGLQIINCSDPSRIATFDKVPFEDALYDVIQKIPQHIKSRGLYLQR